MGHEKCALVPALCLQATRIRKIVPLDSIDPSNGHLMWLRHQLRKEKPPGRRGQEAFFFFSFYRVKGTGGLTSHRPYPTVPITQGS